MRNVIDIIVLTICATPLVALIAATSIGLSPQN